MLRRAYRQIHKPVIWTLLATQDDCIPTPPPPQNRSQFCGIIWILTVQLRPECQQGRGVEKGGSIRGHLAKV